MPVVVVGHPVGRFLFDVGEHLVGDGREARLGVSHVRGRIVVDRVVREDAGREREVLRHVDREVVHVGAPRRRDRGHALREARRDRERAGAMEPLGDRRTRERHELVLRLELPGLAVRAIAEHEPVIGRTDDLRPRNERDLHDRVVAFHQTRRAERLDAHVAVRIQGEDLGAHTAVHHLDELDEGPLLAVHELDLRVAGEAAEVALPLDRRVTHREVLGEARERVVDRHVAVRVVLPHHVADDRRRLSEWTVAAQPHLVHRPEDPALHGLEPVAHVRERARDDDRHRVVEVGLPHLGLELDAHFALAVRSFDHVRTCSRSRVSRSTASRTRANASSVRE